MKSRIRRLTVITFVLGLLPLNIALADNGLTQEHNFRSIAISYNAMDLTNPTKLSSLYARIVSAARNVCGVRNIRVPLQVVRQNHECASQAIDEAIAEINNVRLTAFHQSKLTERRQS